jgi:MYXO-CTERM domain-containing protein
MVPPRNRHDADSCLPESNKMSSRSSRSRWLRLIRGVGAVRPVAFGAVAALCAGAALCSPSGASASPPSAQAPVAGPAMVLLRTTLHPFVRTTPAAGRMDPGSQLTSMSLLFGVSPKQKTAIDALAIELQNAGPRYHQWLTPEQYAAQFGASAADVARATAWLRAQGFTVIGPSRTGSRLEFNGTVAQVEQAFRTEMHYYEVGGVRHFANSAPPSVPADLADAILGVHNLNDFRPLAPVHAKPEYGLGGYAADGGVIPALAPADFAKIYDLGTLYTNNINGTGQHIAIAGQTEINDGDIALFRSTFGLSATGPVRHLVPNTGVSLYSENDITESELDLEWSGGVAPDATIDFVYTGDTDPGGVFDAMVYAVEQKIAPIVSVSYGSGETGLSPADAVFYESLGDSAALLGITVLIAAGDTGPTSGGGQAARRGLSVSYPADIPTVVSVGGSMFNLTPSSLDSNDNALGYISESGWNETAFVEDAGAGGITAGGGGVSQVFAKPYWQIPYTPNDGFRDLPDMALSAAVYTMPYSVAYSWTSADNDGGIVAVPTPLALYAVGGTSAATPSFAGILSLVNQSLLAANPSTPVGLGNVNPILYALANNAATANAFHDITTGNNIVPCQEGSPNCPTTPPYQFGYSCGVGYDQVTGLGSIDAANLVAAFTSLTPTSTTLQITAAGMTEGSQLTLNATVASSATSNSLTGDVTFYFETFDSMGNVDLTGVLGSVAITPSGSGNEGGTAQLMAKAPAGMLQADAGLTGGGKIGAIYGGDIHYLASWSALQQVTGTSNLAVCPGAITMEPYQTGFQFTASGGSAPITWSIDNDSTCARVTVPGPDGGPTRKELCSSISDAGVYTAGPAAGVAQVVALDSNYAYASAYVTVAGTADGGAPLPKSCVPEAGAPEAGVSDSGMGGEDATADATTPEMDAAEEGHGGSGGGSSGCGCVTAGADGNTLFGGLGGALLGLAVAARRRSRTR